MENGLQERPLHNFKGFVNGFGESNCFLNAALQIM